MILDDHGLTLCMVGWNPLAMTIQSNRGHYKCKQPVNPMSLHIFG